MSTATEPTTAPPDESLWKRYSPHHEAPLSGISSLALHLLALGGIALIAIVDMKCNDPDALDLKKRSASADNAKITPVAQIANVTDGGVGKGKDNGTPQGPDKDRIEIGGPDKKDGVPPDVSPPNPVDITPARKRGILEEYTGDENIKRLLERGTDASRPLFNLEKETREALRKSVNPGGGGSGRDGRDTGTDKGPGPGPRKGHLSVIEQRMLRWAMTFNTENGQDYRNQLQGLGAILAFPVRGEMSRFLLIRNLNDPKGQIEDISGLNQIFWIDDKPSSVRSLCAVLGMQPPEYFAAFLPEETGDAAPRRGDGIHAGEVREEE